MLARSLVVVLAAVCLPPSRPLLAGPRVVGRRLPRTLIRRVIHGHLASIRSCYQRQLRVSPQLAGRVLVRFAIDQRGHVYAISIRKNTLRPAKPGHAVAACIERQIRRWRFPHGGSGHVVVSYPFVFRSTPHARRVARSLWGVPTKRASAQRLSLVGVSRVTGVLSTRLARRFALKDIAQLRGCFQGNHGWSGALRIRLIVRPAGTVANADVVHATGRTRTAARLNGSIVCMCGVMRSWRFPSTHTSAQLFYDWVFRGKRERGGFLRRWYHPPARKKHEKQK